jgi:hypothetical protein
LKAMRLEIEDLTKKQSAKKRINNKSDLRGEIERRTGKGKNMVRKEEIVKTPSLQYIYIYIYIERVRL